MSEKFDFTECPFLEKSCTYCEECYIEEFFNSQQEKIEELETKIKKMKNCDNCKYRKLQFVAVVCTHPSNPTLCGNACNLWEMKDE